MVLSMSAVIVRHDYRLGGTLDSDHVSYRMDNRYPSHAEFKNNSSVWTRRFLSSRVLSVPIQELHFTTCWLYPLFLQKHTWTMRLDHSTISLATRSRWTDVFSENSKEFEREKSNQGQEWSAVKLLLSISPCSMVPRCIASVRVYRVPCHKSRAGN